MMMKTRKEWEPMLLCAKIIRVSDFSSDGSGFDESLLDFVKIVTNKLLERLNENPKKGENPRNPCCSVANLPSIWSTLPPAEYPQTLTKVEERNSSENRPSLARGGKCFLQ